MEASNNTVTAEDFAKLQAIAEHATKTAEEAKTAAEARKDVAASVKEEGEAQGVKVDQATAEMIANVTIAQIEARGGFGAPPPEGEAPAPPAPGGAAPPPAAPAPVPVEGETPPPAEGDELVEELEAPAKKTLAERFQGK